MPVRDGQEVQTVPREERVAANVDIVIIFVPINTGRFKGMWLKPKQQRQETSDDLLLHEVGSLKKKINTT